MKTYNKIMRAVFSTPWAVQPEKLEAIAGFLELKLKGGAASADTVAEIRAANEMAAARAQNVSSSSSGAVAVLPLYGLIMHRSQINDLSGPSGTSTQQFSQQLRQAVNDPNVKAIVIDVDSPGGTVEGVDELAQEIYNARKQKKITAVSNCMCASAAYYLAAQASEMVVSPSSLTGSIGVYMMHVDGSKADEMEGLKVTLISYGEHKVDGNSFEPLSDQARADAQSLTDAFGVMFEKAVARGRGVKLDEVQKKFGQGRVFTAKDAVRLGLADRVGTLDEVLQGHGVSRGGAANARAAVADSVAVKFIGVEQTRALETVDWKSDEALLIANPSYGASVRADPQDGDGDEDSDCTCACAECVAGDCTACSHAECNCAGCACDMTAKAAKTKAEHARMRMQLDLAAA